MDVNFLSPESIIMTHGLVSEHSTDSWKCLIEQEPLFNASYMCHGNVLTSPAGNELRIPLMCPPSSPFETQTQTHSYKLNAR